MTHFGIAKNSYMSHLQLGKDYSDKHKEESSKAYSLRKKRGEGVMGKGRKALALIKIRNKNELDYGKAFDKRHGTFEERLKRYGKEMN